MFPQVGWTDRTKPGIHSSVPHSVVHQLPVCPSNGRRCYHSVFTPVLPKSPITKPHLSPVFCLCLCVPQCTPMLMYTMIDVKLLFLRVTQFWWESLWWQWSMSDDYEFRVKQGAMFVAHSLRVFTSRLIFVFCNLTQCVLVYWYQYVHHHHCDHDMVQAASRRTLTAEARVKFQASLCGICGG